MAKIINYISSIKEYALTVPMVMSKKGIPTCKRNLLPVILVMEL